MTDNSSTLREWTLASWQGISRQIELLKPFFARTTGTGTEKATKRALGMLSTGCILTTQSALALVRELSLWDADVLVRSVLEGTFRFAYLCVREDSLRSTRVEEYLVHLPNISRLRTHARAERWLRVVQDREGWRPIRDLNLCTADVEDLRKRYPRDHRKRLEQQWSFSAISEALSNSGIPGSESVIAMVHTYGMSSHVAHMDADGLGMIFEREGRGSERLTAIELAHGAREISDLFSMAMYRTVAAYHLAELNPADAYSTYEANRPLLSSPTSDCTESPGESAHFGLRRGA